MKNLHLILSTLILLSLGSTNGFAQQLESRMKIQLKIQAGGKEIITSLNSVSTSISRYEADPARTGGVKGGVKDSVKKG
ncbi:hypothetical protein [Pedobacter jeongneungensis]|uniref:hypothetical protein n=1 Tax=Pedobacter jeongneungensis TaxID=947309 RepID=UPI0004A81EAC|nr:hypothetical protein [Pedobacter jeongneungensis]